jgi:hypothetical protein
MSDVYKDTMTEIFKEAQPELVAGFKKQMIFIQDQYKHSKKTVQSCLDGMADPPTLVELLAAAYLVNGGVLFKHEDTSNSNDGTKELSDEEDFGYSKLMKEMEDLNCSRKTKEKSPSSTDTNDRDGTTLTPRSQ